MNQKSLSQQISHFKKVGIVGIPPLEIIQELNSQNIDILDLDEPLIMADIENATPYLPRVYCAILRTAVVNALELDLNAIYIDVGPGKCDCALHTAEIMKDFLPIPVFSTRNLDTNGYGFPLCKAEMNLIEKMETITGSVKSAAPYTNIPPACRPTAGFWGVPPRDFSILALFPNTTHIYGWTRCMENKTPADYQLEAEFNPDIPMVFFAQSFCAKTASARYLAKKHPLGLYLDVDVHTTGSAKAKIQAFLDLSGASR